MEFLYLGLARRQRKSPVRIKDMKKNVLVTAVGGASVGSGIVHSLMRANGADARQRWNVIAADADPFAWGLYISDQSVLLPLANDPAYLSTLREVIQRKRIDAVIPGCEAEVEVLSAARSEIPVPVICNRRELVPLMMDKSCVAERLRNLGLPTIETFAIARWSDALAKHDFPFVVKPTVGTGGSRGLHLVLNREELEVLLPKLPTSGKFCIQPYIGSGDDEYTVGVLTDKDGNLIDSIVMHRKLMGLSLLNARHHNGNVHSVSTGFSQGYFVKDRQLQEFCESLAMAIESRGPLNIQLRKHGGEIYVFEIHPRFSGTTTMRADLGFNEPDILLRNVLFDETFDRLNYRCDVAAIRAFEHVIVPVHDMLTRT